MNQPFRRFEVDALKRRKIKATIPQKGGAKRIQKSINFSYPCASAVKCTPIELLFPPGRYVIHLWGAQGGSNGMNKGGKGGYSVGTLSLLKETRLFLYLGGSNAYNPGSVIQAGGFNGGGDGIKDINFGCGGGGGSDLRFQCDNMSTRIIVAGGGGGCGESSSYKAGYGGGNIGGNGMGKPSSVSSHNCLFEGGTQTTAGRASKSESPKDYQQIIGGKVLSAFGYGGSRNRTDNTGWGAGGGGGGWYGGGNGCVFGGSGAGGSGYVLNETSHKPTIYDVSKAYYLNKGMVFGGNSAYGNSGNGHAMIVVDTLFSFIPKYKNYSCCNFVFFVFLMIYK